MIERGVDVFANADQAAILAAASWVERNNGTTPDSEAGILLEEVAAYTAYYFEVGALDASTANQMMHAVEQATWKLHTYHPTVEERNSINMDEAKRQAMAYLETLRDPPPMRRNDTPPGKGFVSPSPDKYAKYPTAPSAAAHADPAMGQVCNELFGPVDGNVHAPAPTGVNWKKVKARRPYVDHGPKTAEFSDEWKQSVKAFVTSANVAVPLAITLGCGVFVVAGGSIFTAAAMTKSAANVLQFAGHALEFGRLHHREAPPRDYAKVIVGAGITLLNDSVFNGLGGKMIFLQRIARNAYNKSPLLRTETRALAWASGYSGDEAKMRAYAASQTVKRVTGGYADAGTRAKYAKMLNEVYLEENDGVRDAIYEVLHPSEWGGTTAALAVGAGAIGVSAYLGWSRFMYKRERQNAYLQKNNPDDAEQWKDQLISYLNVRIKPAIDNGLKAQSQRALWQLRNSLRIKLIGDVDDVYRDLKRQSDDPEYVQVTHFTWKMQKVRREICDLYYDIFNQVLPDNDPNDLPPRNPPKGPCDRPVTAFGATAATGVGGRWAEWVWGDVHNEDEGPAELKVPPPWGDGPAPERKWGTPPEPSPNDDPATRRAYADREIAPLHLKLITDYSAANQIGWPTEEAMRGMSVANVQLQRDVTRLALKINLAAAEDATGNIDVRVLKMLLDNLSVVRRSAQVYEHNITHAHRAGDVARITEQFDQLGFPFWLARAAERQLTNRVVQRTKEQQERDAERRVADARQMNQARRQRNADQRVTAARMAAVERRADARLRGRHTPCDAAHDAESVVDVVFGELGRLNLS